MGDPVRNILQALRHLRRRPVLSAVGIGSLAVGIGCALAAVGVLNAVVFRAFPYRDAHRLVVVWENNAKRGVGLTTTSLPNFQDLAAGASSLSGLHAFIDDIFSLDTVDGTSRAFGYRVGPGMFEQVGVAALVGRVLTADDYRPDAPEVVVLSHHLWAAQFGSDPAVVGRTLRLTGVPFTVAGVMPPSFVLPPVFNAQILNMNIVIEEGDLWIPMKYHTMSDRRDLRSLYMLGRLREGKSVADAQSEATIIGARLAADFPAANVGLDFAVVPLDQQVLSPVRTLLVALLIAGALVLVIAAANAAHLLLADSLTTSGDAAVRAALGATTWRLAASFAGVSVLWCVAATIGALVVAWLVEAPLATYAHANVPRLRNMRVDGVVVLVAAVIALLMTLAVTALPLFNARRIAGARSVNGAAIPIGMSAWRRAFVAVQLALALVVLSTAASLYRSASALAQVNPGFVAEGVTTFDVLLPASRYAEPQSRIDFQTRVIDALADLPGRQAAAAVDFLPFGGTTQIVNVTIEDDQARDPALQPKAALRAVTSEYFDTFSIPLVRGRWFMTIDNQPDVQVAIVSEAFARSFAPNLNLLGRRIKRGSATSKNPWMTVVGIVGSVRGAGLAVDPQPEVYVPHTKGSMRDMVTIAVKAGVPPQALTAAVIDRIHQIDVELNPISIAPMTAVVGRALGQPYFYARLFGVLAFVAFALSLAGIYGVAVLGVAARSNEIAIRSCLGAQANDIVRLILRETLIAVGLAVVVGTLGAWLLQARIAAYVYGLGAADWVALAGSALALSSLALAVVYLAIRRVLVLRPLDLLRRDAGALA
jgi:putative ABC transport system permease protein